MKKALSQIFNSRVLVVLILFIELLVFIFAAVFFIEYLAEIRTLLTIIAVIVALFVFNSRCNSSYKISWLCFLVIAPILGSFCYILFANKKFTKSEKKKYRPTYEALKIANASKEGKNALYEINREKDPDAFYFGKYLNDYSNTGIYKNSEVTYYPWGELAFKAMLKELKKAKHYIFMEYFIIAKGRMWDEILKILSEKVKEGVDIRLMYDDLGSLSTLPSNYYRTMNEIGIKCIAVNRMRIYFDIRMNNRDHRKILVIDGHTGFTGGINIADEYINEKIRFGKWKDNAIMIKGDAVFALTSLFLSHWTIYDKKSPLLKDYSPYLASVYSSENDKHIHSDGLVAPYGSLPFTYETVGENVYLSLIAKARKYIYITTPYLIMDEQLNNALILSAKAGVKIHLLTPHIPDKKAVFELTRSYYKDLVEAGVKVYEYTPGFVHAKTFLVDGIMATVGTINLDYRSLFLHLENGCFLYKCSCIKDIEKDMIETFSNSREITKEMVNSSPLSKRIYRALLKIFSSAM